MAKTRGTGLLMVWTDIDPQFEVEFNNWYDEEHLPRLLEVPGFLSAGRYVAVKGAPKYLAMWVAQKIAADPARPHLGALRRGLILDRVEVGRAA